MNPSRTLLARIGVLVLAGSVLVGCTPVAKPTSTPTAAFASKEEAYKAAEKTYRAYTAASDDPTGEPAKFLTGTALKGYLEGVEYLKTNKQTVSGHTEILDFVPKTVKLSPAATTIAADVCIDISKVRVIDSTGKDVTPADRASLWRMKVTFVGDSNLLSIDRSAGTEDPTCSPN